MQDRPFTGAVEVSRSGRVDVMRNWTRWQDYLSLVAGVYAVLAPIWVDVSGAGEATASLIVMGALLALASLWSLAQPGVVAVEWLHALFGVLLFAAPWVLSYSDHLGAAWTSWIVGAVAVIAGLWAVPGSQAVHRHQVAG
jgi:hypothetical protein